MNTRTKLQVQAVVVVVSLLASFFVGFASPVRATTGDLLISGVIDGPLTGGVPKAIELYVVNDIADLSIYGLGSANNGGGSDGEEFTFPADSATAGDFIYVASEATGFTSFFEFAPNYTSGAASINGDDAIELFQNGLVVDVFGDINTDGTGQPWEYMDGWTYRVDGTGADGATFILANWSFSGPNALDGETSNATAATPFPIGTYLPGGGPDYTPIYDIQYTGDPSGDSPLKDQSDVTTEGIVTARFQYGYFIEDPAGGAWNGLWVHDTANSPALGDRVRLTGTVLEYYNLTELDILTDYGVESSSNPLPAPVVLSTADVSQEQYEGVLVRVESVTVTNEDLGHGEWSVSDGLGDVIIDDKGSYTYTPVDGDALAAVIGPLDFGYGAFKMQPRDDNDIILPAPPSALVINEILADPASGLPGDANGDGVRDSSDDEFVEIVNNSDSDMDISGWTLSDAVGVRHTFPADTVVFANCAIVVFGGGTPTGPFGGVVVQTASSGALGLNNGGDTVTLNDGTTDLVVVTYGGEGGDNQSLTRDPDITGPFVKHSTATGSGGALFSPGTMIDGSPFAGCGPVFGACGDLATFIHEVQGSGGVSPLNGASGVVIEGVVVGDFQDISTQLKGFFLQEEDSEADTNPATSEGIFVYDYGFMDVNVGDVVRVMGNVAEYYDLTELNYVSNMAVCPAGGVASAATVTLPVDSLDVWEQYEGMLINIPQTLYASGNYNQGRYGEVDLSVGDRLDNPTNVVLPGAEAIALQDLNDRSRIQLEDGSTVQNPLPLPPYIGDGNTLRAGDTIPELTGVLHYSFGAYELHPTGAVNFTRVNARDEIPPDVGGTLNVASFNVLNYFVTLDDGSCPYSGGCRGADNAVEFTRQRDKIIAAIVEMDADVIGLMEMENHPDDAALQDLVSGLNDVAGDGTYDYIATGPVGADVIKVAFIYRPSAVTPVGSYAILDSSVDPTFNDDKNRPALAQTFEQNGTGGTFTAVVNHLKSKGSSCDDIGDPDMGDGQGNCNLTRTAAATALVNWLAGDPTGSGDTDFLIIGDLNSYAMEDPIAAITSEGYTNLIESFVGPDAYSYVFYGQAGYLDHALSSPDLTSQVTGVVEWHINADEPAALDYNDYNQPDLYSAGPYRASDHDPVIVGLDLQPEVVPFEAFQVIYAKIRWHKSDRGYFKVYGRLELPDGYTRDDLTRDLELAIAIDEESGADTVSMTEHGRVWYFRTGNYHSVEGVQITRAVIIWPEAGDLSLPIFTLRGRLLLPGVNSETRPAEATIDMGLPVAGDLPAERVVGEETISFRTFHRLWMYRLWHK